MVPARCLIIIVALSPLRPKSQVQTDFRATLDLDSGSSLPVFVKLIPGSYGVEVHRFLGTKHLAPALYGYSKVDGVPIAYIMEYLDPSEWSTLHELIHFGDALPSDARLRGGLRSVVGALESGSYVHGDLRPNNFMVGIDEATEEIEVKVIDFDWAGQAGEVYYPAKRNPSIEGIEWPRKAGGIISLGDDEKLVKSWFDLYSE